MTPSLSIINNPGILPPFQNFTCWFKRFCTSFDGSKNIAYFRAYFFSIFCAFCSLSASIGYKYPSNSSIFSRFLRNSAACHRQYGQCMSLNKTMITFFLFMNSLILILSPLEFGNSNSGIFVPTSSNLSLIVITQYIWLEY